METGIGIANANSYVSRVDADSYHSLYNNTDWTGLDADKEQALILATRALDLLYGPRFLSFKRITNVSPLLFPRMFFYDNNQHWVTETTIPQCIKDAVCEIALMHMNGVDIFPLPNTDSNIKSNKIEIGPIKISNDYSSNQGVTETFSSFRKIDLILWTVLKQKLNRINFVL